MLNSTVPGSQPGRAAHRSAHVPSKRTGLKLVTDLVPGRGPLAGLQGGLLASPSPYCWLVGCDMPFLEPALLRYLMAQASAFDAVVPVVEGRLQTLHAVYSRRLLPAIAELLARGDSSLHALIEGARVRYVQETEAGGPEAWRRSCLNINTESDLQEARALVVSA